MKTNQPDIIQTGSHQEKWAQQRTMYLAKLSAAHVLAPLPVIPAGTNELSDDELQAISAKSPQSRPAHELISEDRDDWV